MTSKGTKGGDSTRDEVIAGEYVLGVLSAEDRRKVESRLATDRAFAAMVDRWQSNLSSFDDDYQPIAPPKSTYAAIEKRLFAETAFAPARQPRGLWNSIGFWRGFSLASVAGIAGLLAFGNGNVLMPRTNRTPLVAEMKGKDAPIDLVAHYDATSGVLDITPVAAGAAQEKSLELWLVKPDGKTVSLGVLPQTGEGSLSISPDLRTGITKGATLAVSVEPFGGSPTGTATGPVILVGAMAE